MRILSFAAIFTMGMAISIHSFGFDTDEKCFPWEANLNQGEDTKLSLSAGLCYKVARDEQGAQQIWGSHLTTEAEASGFAFGNDLILGTWLGGMTLTDEGAAQIRGEFFVAGQEILNRSFSVDNVAVDKTFPVIGFEQNVARRIMLGVIPATISFGIMTDGHINLNAKLEKSSVNMGTLPFVHSNAYAKAGFGEDAVFIGFSGGVEIVDEELALSAQIDAPRQGENIRLEVYGKNKVKALTGSVDATISVDGNKFVQNIASYPGIEREDVIWDTRGELQ